VSGGAPVVKLATVYDNAVPGIGGLLHKYMPSPSSRAGLAAATSPYYFLLVFGYVFEVKCWYGNIVTFACERLFSGLPLYADLACRLFGESPLWPLIAWLNYLSRQSLSYCILSTLLTWFLSLKNLPVLEYARFCVLSCSKVFLLFSFNWISPMLFCI